MKDYESYQQQVEKLNRDILHHISSFLRIEFDQWKISETQYHTLAYIFEHDGCTIGSCAQAIHQDAGNMSSLCKKLETKGFLYRKRRMKDERIVELSLSELGYQCIHQIKQHIAQHYDSEWNRYDDKEKDLILNGLTKLNHFFEKVHNHQKKAGTSK